ncbi:MAG: hypothetical protein ACM3SU_03075 [Acidobacteriota bacterium]
MNPNPPAAAAVLAPGPAAVHGSPVASGHRGNRRFHPESPPLHPLHAQLLI